jgi:DNA-binding Lrp family transcriptional regulator
MNMTYLIKSPNSREVIEIHPLFGEYDVIAKIEATYYENLGEIIVNKIRPIGGITDIKTITGLNLH